MTDEQIIFHWRRSTKNFNACKALAQLSQRKITEIIDLICASGYMSRWTNNKHIIRVKGNKHGDKKAKISLSDT